ncbi:MAG: glucose-1-phosphate thymidylyltransferase [Candidatus Marinimicrobia bacterium]|nr:glucose-1-phosphate thymidylyltransferase [Candidatus Neomarinimicrobiota bacterium]
MKGIILAGGSGTRMFPTTKVISKHLLPVYDKPMIYYPLSTLMLAGIKEILIISTSNDLPFYEKLLGNGLKLGLSITYKVQDKPNGIAEAFIIGENFIGSDNVALILGDNILYGKGLSNMLKNAIIDVENNNNSIIYGYSVKDSSRYGVVEFDNQNNIISIEEKPKNPKSNYAVIGLYFYTNEVIKHSKTITPSGRGELEITDVNNIYINNKNIKVDLLGRGYAWLDTGTPQSLLSASNFIQMIEDRQGLKISCIEEIAFRMNFINNKQLKFLVDALPKSEYKNYIKSIL